MAVMLSFGFPVSFIDRIKGTGAILIYQVQSVAFAKEAAADRRRPAPFPGEFSQGSATRITISSGKRCF
jgi:hypothetical protein